MFARSYHHSDSLITKQNGGLIINKFLTIIPNEQETLIIGPLPPPIGGVSIFLQRLKSVHSCCTYYDLKNMDIFNYFELIKELRSKKYKLIFVNAVTLKLVILTTIFFKGKIIFVEHNNRIKDKGTLWIAIYKYILRRHINLWVVSQSIKESYEELEIKPKNEIIEVQSAYLPPCTRDYELKFNSFSSDVKTFIKSPTICVSAYKIIFTKGRDLYGIDTSVRLLNELNQKGHNLQLLLVIPDLDEEGASYIDDQIANNSLNKSKVLVLNKPVELWPLFRHLALFVRPTISDGFGVSVAEAVDEGCPTIASNVCYRYEGCITYDVDDFDDLMQKCCSVIGRDKK